jgi:hypothetical protein
MKINIKALSVNKAWRGGQRYRSKDYIEYEAEIWNMLGRHDVDPSDKLMLQMEVGYSNEANDLSNSIKCFEDILAKKCGFNDKKIYRLVLDKVIVPKGEEYIDYKLTKIDG